MEPFWHVAGALFLVSMALFPFLVLSSLPIPPPSPTVTLHQLRGPPLPYLLIYTDSHLHGVPHTWADLVKELMMFIHWVNWYSIYVYQL